MTAPKNPAPIGLPLTVSAAQVMKNMGLKPDATPPLPARRAVSTASLRPAEAAPFGRSAAAAASGERPATKAEREAAMRHASYNVGDTTPSKVDLSRSDLPGPMLLEVTQIDAYEGNPRQFENEATDDIRASLMAHGYTDAMVVTRRREGDRFMLAAGSNTTLKVLQGLWQTTGEERFRYVNCVFQPFESEAKVLAQHLGENLNRGSMKFWEIAVGMTSLLAMLSHERGKPLSVRDQVAALNERGLRSQPTDVAFWAFAVERLEPLGSARRLLTRECVRAHLQPRLNALLRLALKFKVDEAVYWQRIVGPALAAAGASAEANPNSGQLDGDATSRTVEGAFAEHVGESLTSVHRMLGLLKVSPELTLADLRLPPPGPLPSPVAAPADGHPPQPPLPLGPGLVRSGAASNGSGAAELPVGTDADLPAASASAVPALSRHSPPSAAHLAPSADLPGEAPHAAPSTHGRLFAQAGPDPLAALHESVRQLLAIAGLVDTLRLRDEMPLGFFIEFPDRALHARRSVDIGSAEHQARTIKTLVWWVLVLMTGQYREGSVPYMDLASAFYRFAARDTDGSNPLEGTDIDETAPEIEDILMQRMSAGAIRPVMRQLALVEDLAAELFAAAPERWRRMLEVNRQR